MAAMIQLFFFSTIPLATATNITVSNGFDRQKCYLQTLEWLKNGTLAMDDEVFFRDSAGQPFNHPKNLILTLAGSLLLICNVDLSPLDKRKFLAVVHLIGDPLDSLSSIINKIDSWNRCQTLAQKRIRLCGRCQRIVATVFAGFEEVQGPRVNSDTYYITLLDKHDIKTQFREWRRAAVALADSRTDEFPWACLAILLYIFQLIASFVKAVGGGNTSPPGGRIATGVFLSWLLPIVLLSNAIGNFPSRRTCYDILSQFAKQTEHRLHIPPTQSTLGFSSFARSCSSDYHQSLVWSGGIYTFRPWKWQYESLRQNWSRAAFILLLSIMPLCIGTTGGFIILLVTVPAGLNCRHSWLIGIFLAWCASAFITLFSNSPKYATGKYHWYLVLIKDTLVAVPSITVIILSACGLFNSCYCWSGILHDRKGAQVPLQVDVSFHFHDYVVFPLIVGVCNTAQLLLFVLIRAFLHRGFGLFRWSESMLRTERGNILSDTACDCMNNAPYADQSKHLDVEIMNQRAQSRHENAGFLDPTSTLDAVNYLGKLYAAQGKYADANEMYWRALDGKEKAWGPDHPCTLETVNNLGALYTDQGKHAEAETMYQRALDGYKRYWDLDHPSTLHTTSNLQDLDRSEDRSKSKTRYGASL